MSITTEERVRLALTSVKAREPLLKLADRLKNDDQVQANNAADELSKIIVQMVRESQERQRR
tara:strand:- start:157 stop:342 length:186 start_codon:yes stop_codon:yes gene_type:complete